MTLSTFQKALLIVAGGVGALTSFAAPAWTLTQEEIVTQLRPVPVFTITDGNGAPLVSEQPGNEDAAPIARVFITEADAQQFLGSIQENNPELGADVRITPVPLSSIYTTAVNTQEGENELDFVFIPSQAEAESAVEILKDDLEAQGEDPSAITDFRGVPLFTARSSTADDNQGYLTIQVNDQQIVPLFFSYAELQALISNIGEGQPDFAAGLDPYVIRLEELIDTLESTEDQTLLRLQLIPSEAAIQAAQEAAQDVQDAQGEAE
ncbi:MAG: Tic22 family protein [Cyanobacteria bacterium P01_A01_bin.135]